MLVQTPLTTLASDANIFTDGVEEIQSEVEDEADVFETDDEENDKSKIDEDIFSEENNDSEFILKDNAGVLEQEMQVLSAGDEITYTDKEDLTWELDSEGTLTISGKGGISFLNAQWWNQYDKSEIKNLVIKEGITFIEDPVFSKCIGLQSVILPDSLISIGYGVFSGCINLNSVILSDSLVSIGRKVFLNCSNLVNITLPDSLSDIGESAFSGCSSLKSISLPNLLSTIKYSTFSDCSSLSSINLPSSLTVVGESAFFGCSSLSSINLPDSLTTIEYSAFMGCSSLNNIIFPDSLTTIGKSAFEGCSSLSSINLAGSLTVMESNAFSWCINLKNVSLPDSLTTIKYSAFKGCSNLSTITLPNSLMTIEDCAFEKCSSLKSISFPRAITTIGNRAFFDCSSLSRISLPDSLVTIGYSVFAGCSNLCSISIPSSLTAIGDGAFEACSSLSSINLPDSLSTIGDVVFSRCSSLSSINLPDSLSAIGNDAFSGCSSLSSINLPDSLSAIGNGAFSGCSSLSGINLPDSLTTIKYDTFRNCDSLSRINLPNSLTDIGDNAFLGCRSLSRVSFPDSLVTIGNSAFGLCSSLDSVSLPNSLVVIGDDAFWFCSKLSDVYIKSSKIYIGERAFSDSPIVNLYYEGNEEQWKKLYEDSEGLEEIIHQIEQNGGKIHYNSTGDESGGDETENQNRYMIGFFSKWDAENQTAYFGENDLLGSQVTEETDLSFLKNLDNLLGKYVLVERKNRTDNHVGSYTLISIKSVETKAGTVTATEGKQVTIEGNSYQLAQDISFPDFYVNEFVLYHILDDGTIYIQELEKTQGTLTYWNAQTRRLLIGSTYELAACADKESLDFLGDTNYSRVYVQFWHDNLYHIYKITKTVDKTSETGPDFWETFVPATEEENRLWNDVDDWDKAYKAYIEAVRNALFSFSGTEGEKKEMEISAEAKRMQEEDKHSSSKYLSGDLGQYSDYAYKALASYLYEYTCDNIKFNSVDAAGIVNAIYKSCIGAEKTYQYGNIDITITAMGMNKSSFGSLMIEDHERKPKQVINVIICSTQKEITQSVNNYMNTLQDLAVDSAVNVASAVFTDILGKSLSSLSEEVLSKSVEKIEKKLAVKLSEKFKIAGVGDLIHTLDECYSYYNYVHKNMGTIKDIENIQAFLGNIEKLEFKDTTIKDAAVKKTLGALKKAKTKFIRSYEKYIEGTLGTSNHGFFNMYINCPVDVEVYNSNNEKIGCASETELWYDDSIEIMSQNDSKIITVLTKELPSVKILSREYGTMDCTIEELNDAHTPVGRLSYYNISLTPGQEYNMSLNNNLKQNKDTMAIETNGQSILADEYISVQEPAGVLISCKVEADDGSEGGSVRGVGTYIRGDAVILSATPDINYLFAGWYQGGTLISLKRNYEFTARNDMVLTAKFTSIQRIHIEIKSEGGGTVSGADDNNEYLEGETVTVTAIPDEGKEFVGWYCDGTKISDDATYQFVATNDIILTARFTDKENSVCNHIFDTGEITKKASCKEEGERCYTCTICGQKKTEVIPKTAHVFDKGIVTKKPTIDTTGEKVFTCTVCGQKQTEIIEKLQEHEHTFDTGKITKEANCKEEGERCYTCTICGQKKTEVISKTDHVFDEGIVTKKPTIDAAGEKIFTCTVCGEKTIRNYGEKLKPIIKLNVTSIVLQKNQGTKSVKVTMANGDAIKSWKSSNKKIVTVNSNGVIRAQKQKGTAKITITLKSGKKATLKIKVQSSKVQTTDLKNLKSKVTVKKGGRLTLKPIVFPITSQEKVTYISSDKKVATVNSKGVIRAKKKGVATIIVKSGMIVKKIKVTVK